MASCKKSDPVVEPTPPVVTPTVVGIAQSDTSFSILVAAVVKAGLVNTLSDLTKSYTVFAPTNNAFRAAGFTEASINGLSAADVTNVLTPILTYHVLGSKVLASGVPASDAVTTLNTKKLFASSNANGVFLNGVKVVTPNLNASNGVVHVIGKVLIPPTQTIAQIVTTNPSFSLLLRAVSVAGLASTLDGPGKFTVFAPVNTGFPNSLNTNALIDAAMQPACEAIVKSHAFGTNICAGDLVAGVTGPTLNTTKTLTITLPPATAAPTVKIVGGTNTNASNITTTDIIATNGIIHVIDRLLQ